MVADRNKAPPPATARQSAAEEQFVMQASRLPSAAETAAPQIGNVFFGARRGPPVHGAGILRAAVAAAMVVFGCRSATAESGQVDTLKLPGLDMTVDGRWVDGPGYRPVRIEIVPTAPVTADRTIAVEVAYRQGMRRGRRDLRVVQDIEVPGGTGPVQATLAVPQHAGWGQPVLNVFEDGTMLGTVATRWGDANMDDAEWNEVLLKLLVVGKKPPDTSAMGGLFSIDPSRPTQLGSTPAGFPNLPTAAAVDVPDLPARWIDYTCLDVICLTIDQLDELRSNRPEAFEAIVSWAAAGGNLWVCGLGEKWQRLPELESLLGMAQDTPGPKSTPTSRSWREQDVMRSRPILRDPLREPLGASSMPRSLLEEVYSDDGAPLGPGVARAFLTRDFQMGMIVALGPEEPLPGSEALWASVLDAMGPDRWCWVHRHGLSVAGDNPDFWDFLIPGVGMAPTLEFCLLITVFVVVIGPVNYLLLRRWRRLHLLVITIPAGAALVTLVLYGYALIADGLGVKVRARSVAWIDQRSGRTACWSRLSYYAGLTPSEGLRFPDDVAVFPLERVGQWAYPGESRDRDLFWGSDQWLARGWLGPRTPTQYVTVRSRHTELGVDFLAAEGDGANPRVRNRLGTAIEHLILCDGTGACYRADDVEVDAEAALDPVRPADAAELIRSVARDPAEMPGPNSWRNPGYRRRQRYGRYPRYSPGVPMAEPDQRTSRLESALREAFQPSPAAAGPLRPRSYVAVVEEGPEVVFGVPSAKEKASFHVIVGRW